MNTHSRNQTPASAIFRLAFALLAVSLPSVSPSVGVASAAAQAAPAGGLVPGVRAKVTTVDGAEIRGRSFAKGGAVIGGLGGAVAGAYLRSLVCSGSTDCGGESAVFVVAGAGAGVIAGALVGAIVGSATTRWTEAKPESWSEATAPIRLQVGLEGLLVAASPQIGFAVSIPLPH